MSQKRPCPGAFVRGEAEFGAGNTDRASGGPARPNGLADLPAAHKLFADIRITAGAAV
jgi:hypothetical protein